ncbi:hypothetical protein GCM10008949_27640 [Deinococcus humi]|nr:hypothetical protein GCM10008949_27640 [Deinococcus humi]
MQSLGTLPLLSQGFTVIAWEIKALLLGRGDAVTREPIHGWRINISDLFPQGLPHWELPRACPQTKKAVQK